MNVGDRVVYVLNDQINLNRDCGTVVGLGESASDCCWVLFDDGAAYEVDQIDLRPLVDLRPVHGHFGCLEDPCPVHNSTSDDEG
jgi:hypothetical protein